MTAIGAAALAWAVAHASGLPYVYAGTGPGSYDCSGLTQRAYKAVGVNLPRTSQEQRNAGVSIPLSQAQPGDLLTFSYPNEGPSNPAPANHVTMYVNPTTVFAASHSGVPIGYAPLDRAHLDRVIRVGGSAAASSAGTTSAATYSPAGQALGAVEPVDVLAASGYEPALTLTPWGIPLNPLKLPGYLAGKGGQLAGEAGTSVLDGVITGFMQALGPLLLTITIAAAGLGLVGMGLWRASAPARDAANEKVAEGAQVAMLAA